MNLTIKFGLTVNGDVSNSFSFNDFFVSENKMSIVDWKKLSDEKKREVLFDLVAVWMKEKLTFVDWLRMNSL